MIHPHLLYIDFVVDSDQVLKLDRLQEKAIRRIKHCVHKKKRKNIKVLKEEFYIEPLVPRRQRNLVKIIHKKSIKDT